MAPNRKTSINTRLVHGGRYPHDNHGVINPPVYRASTILKPTLADWKAMRDPASKAYTYGRAGVPTTRSFEEVVAELYGAADAVAVSSGLASVVGCLFAVLSAGDHLLMVDSAYGPTRKFCDVVLTRYGIETTYYDPLIGAGIESLIKENTKAVYTESPGSLTFEVQDLPAIAEVAHRHGAAVLLDNTWATPLYLDPLALGVDIVNEAVTKYINGHSDVMMGVIVSNEHYAKQVRTSVKLQGQYSSPDELYLAQRGIRTLGVRLRQAEQTGLSLARWLKQQEMVEAVLHPALEDDPGHEIWKRDFTGASGLFAIVLKPAAEEAFAAMIDGFELFGLGASWGGYESLVKPGNVQAERSATTWPYEGPLLRINAGLEDPEDLITDLRAGLERYAAIAGV